MQIPDSFLGLWQGIVTDSHYKESFPCVLALNKETGEAFYQKPYYKSKGLTKGLLTAPTEENGVLLLHQELQEDTGSQTWERGTLSLRLLENELLECKWAGNRYTAEAILNRIRPSSI